MSKKVEKFVKQICLNLLRKKSNYDIKYNRDIIKKRGFKWTKNMVYVIFVENMQN